MFLYCIFADPSDIAHRFANIGNAVSFTTIITVYTNHRWLCVDHFKKADIEARGVLRQREVRHLSPLSLPNRGEGLLGGKSPTRAHSRRISLLLQRRLRIASRPSPPSTSPPRPTLTVFYLLREATRNCQTYGRNLVSLSRYLAGRHNWEPTVHNIIPVAARLCSTPVPSLSQIAEKAFQGGTCQHACTCSAHVTPSLDALTHREQAVCAIYLFAEAHAQHILSGHRVAPGPATPERYLSSEDPDIVVLPAPDPPYAAERTESRSSASRLVTTRSPQRASSSAQASTSTRWSDVTRHDERPSRKRRGGREESSPPPVSRRSRATQREYDEGSSRSRR